MLCPSDCFVHAPALPPNPLWNLTALAPGPRRRATSPTFRRNAVSAPARTAQTYPNFAVPCTVSRQTAEGKEKGKWVHYGGSIPAMLDAAERVQDIGEALWPWKDTLSNRERTIILKEQKDWRRVVEIFDWFHRERFHEVNVIRYNVVFCAVGRARRWDLVIGLWHDMRSCGMEPDTRNTRNIGLRNTRKQVISERISTA